MQGTDSQVTSSLHSGVPTPSKRQKISAAGATENAVDFRAKLFECIEGSSQGLSQDEMTLSVALITIVNDIDSASAQTYLRSEEALKSDSSIRKMIESGLIGLADLEPGQIASIIFASLLLSDSTFELYKPGIKTLPDKD